MSSGNIITPKVLVPVYFQLYIAKGHVTLSMFFNPMENFPPGFYGPPVIVEHLRSSIGQNPLYGLDLAYFRELRIGSGFFLQST